MMRSNIVLVCWALLGCCAVVLSVPVAAHAADEVEIPPDVVGTKDGGLYRGVIVAKVPGEYVEITLSNGESKRFAMDDVEYAGPREGLSPPNSTSDDDATKRQREHGDSNERATRQTVTIVAEEVPVSLESSTGRLTFYRRTATASAESSSGSSARAVGYDEMCTTPCKVTMPAGTHTFALGRTGAAEPTEAEPVTLLNGATTLTGTHVDNSDSRVLGRVLLVGGLLGGLAVTLAGTADSENGWTYTGVGIGMMVGGLVLGFATSRSDEARIEVSQLAPRRASVNPGVAYRNSF